MISLLNMFRSLQDSGDSAQRALDVWCYSNEACRAKCMASTVCKNRMLRNVQRSGAQTPTNTPQSGTPASQQDFIECSQDTRCFRDCMRNPVCAEKMRIALGGIQGSVAQQQGGVLQGTVVSPDEAERRFPLGLPSRANQKQNIFNKAFDPKNRKIIVLLIAGFLLAYAASNYK